MDFLKTLLQDRHVILHFDFLFYQVISPVYLMSMYG